MGHAIEALRDFVRPGMHVGTPISMETIRDAVSEFDRVAAALDGVAMRSFTADGSLCWCDGPVLDPASWQHDPDCTQAREARGY